MSKADTRDICHKSTALTIVSLGRLEGRAPRLTCPAPESDKDLTSTLQTRQTEGEDEDRCAWQTSCPGTCRLLRCLRAHAHALRYRTWAGNSLVSAVLCGFVLYGFMVWCVI